MYPVVNLGHAMAGEGSPLAAVCLPKMRLPVNQPHNGQKLWINGHALEATTTEMLLVERRQPG